jgi:hypothetical protein
MLSGAILREIQELAGQTGCIVNAVSTGDRLEAAGVLNRSAPGGRVSSRTITRPGEPVDFSRPAMGSIVAVSSCQNGGPIMESAYPDRRTAQDEGQGESERRGQIGIWREGLNQRHWARCMSVFVVALMSGTIAIAQTDTTGPILTDFGFSPSSIDTLSGPDEITFSFTATDDISGVTFFNAQFRSPSGSQGSGVGISLGGGLTESASLTHLLPGGSEPGFWTITKITMSDAVGNSTTLSTEDIQALAFPTQFNVVSVADVTAPALAVFAFSPAFIDLTGGPADITFEFTATDDLAGVTFFNAQFRSPSGSQGSGVGISLSGDVSESASLQHTFSEGSEPGIWTVTKISMTDAVGNLASLTTESIAGMGFPTQFEIASIVDSTAPSLVSFGFSPTVIDVSSGAATITFNFTAEDDFSGVTYFNAQFRSPSGNQGSGVGVSLGGSTTESASLPHTFPAGTEPGIWTVTKITMHDGVGNYASLLTGDITALGLPTQFSVIAEQEVTIDIKPGSDPNCFNINGHGVIPVAILGSSRFDVTEVDTWTVAFGGLEVRVRGNKGPLCGVEDSNGDGLADLVCHFEDDPANWSVGGATATLTGSLHNGRAFKGTDDICVVP